MIASYSVYEAVVEIVSHSLFGSTMVSLANKVCEAFACDVFAAYNID